jgi:rhodanese-related sulfurtransferase
MGYRKLVKESIILLGIAVIAALAVNFFSPKGIALLGQWDKAQGVITAKARDDVVVENREIRDVKQAKQIYDNGKAIFVDARSGEDYESGHIPGAVSLPAGQFDQLVDAFIDQHSSDQLVVTYCSGRTCDDSHKLAQLLSEAGFKNVKVFIDGYPGWKREGYPVE